MVKLYHIGVLYKRENNSIICLRHASDLSTFGFFQRNSVGEFMRFTAKMIVERCELATRSSLQQQEYLCHCYIRSDRLAGIVISDNEYPNRVAHTLLSKILEEFTQSVPSIRWPTMQEGQAPYTKLDQYLARFQNPKEADAMTKLQTEIDETKIILHDAITGILERGEKLDNLVEKSEELSTQSKLFYKTARKTNQCCQYY
ncbi:YKT6 v-SNARE homolog [Dermatophagoides farinae]|uniref:Palmitoyltransferase n=1 Tax=Dermatophagoides farinae TaxID=6954 RepID=A0A922HN22_DERFA|nr:synaptobrevin homolog YKT6-like [Dermatophagoides farinae]KAH7645321.1 synaptobrevin ykt6-like protein [Dermatophagoides farinae]KAH9497862.1 palmitoyltransferase [Dermatophagoides farinae]